MQDITLSTDDLVIVAVYFLLVFSIGFYMARRTRCAEDLFLAGRPVAVFLEHLIYTRM
jgi:SSS family solute:Na+ symporter